MSLRGRRVARDIFWGATVGIGLFWLGACAVPAPQGCEVWTRGGVGTDLDPYGNVQVICSRRY